MSTDDSFDLNRKYVRVTHVRPEGLVEFDFAIGGNTGRYTLMVSQGGRQELMEFQAGPEPPTGQVGPSRIFNPDHT